MAQINITQPIDNPLINGTNGYIDEIESQIKNVSQNEDLNGLINTPGGDITSGRRLFRAVLEHEGSTKVNVVGQAASYGGLLLAAFDEVHMDFHSRVMLHKAHTSNDVDSEAEKKEISVFNETAHALLKAKSEKNALKNTNINLAESIKLLDEIFLSDSKEDYWFSAIEARDKLGIVDTVTDVKREDGRPELKLVAIANDYKNKFLNSFNSMGIFNKKKVVPRVLNMKDGRSLVFNSESTELQKGDKVAVVDSDEVLDGKVEITDELTAEVKDNEIVDLINEEVSEEVSNQLDEATKEEVAGMIQEAVAPIMEKLEQMAGGTEAKKDDEEEMEAKLEAKINQLLAETKKQIVGGYKVPKIESKNESIFDGMSPKEKQVIKKIDFVNSLNKTE